MRGVSLCLSLAMAAMVVDVALSDSIAVPPEWKPRIEASNMMYAVTDVGVAYKPMLANGFVGTQIGTTTAFMAGVFNGVGNITPSHRAQIPSMLPNVSVANAGAKQVGCALDIERATYYRRTLIGTSSVVEQRWYASRSNRSLLVMELHALVVPGGGSVTIQLAGTQPMTSSPDASFTIVQHSAAQIVTNGSTLLAEDAAIPVDVIAMAATPVPAALTMSQGDSAVFIEAFHSSLDAPGKDEPIHAAVASLKWATSHASTLHTLHQAEWAKLWTSGYEIAGRRDVARAVNTSLYAILSAVRDDWDFSLSPGGLSSGYNGHTFWDCETWMYPNMLMLFRDVATGLIRYRYNRIAGGDYFASHTNYSGTRFPWESAFTGRNVCPQGVGTCLQEIHVNGDIAFALRQYWWLTRNTTWLKAVAVPILTGISDFWLSRAVKDSQGVASINDVIPPDEYATHVNNSVYTNAVARITLEFTTEAVTMTGGTPNPAWNELAQALVILFNGTIHPEYAGYAGQTIKQADVILLGFPLDVSFGHMTKAVRKADLDYYSARTSSAGPAMTWGMTAIGYIATQHMELAYANFNRSFANVQEPFLVWSETPSGGTTNFITGAGGFVQTVLFGWPQLRIRDGSVNMQPLLPQGASFAKLRGVDVYDAIVDIAYDASTVTLAAASQGGSVVVGTKTANHTLSPGSRLSLANKGNITLFPAN